LRLAVCDTGVDPAHPDLAGTLADGSPRLVEGVDVTAPDGAYADSAAHGTMVAGIMAARTHDGPHFDSLGIAGVCGGDGTTTAGCGLIPVKITRGSGSAASSFAIAQGILHAACAGARAINLSFAATGPSRTERLALLDALVRGAVVVCAAGNNGLRDGSASMWPAAHAADGLCVQVGACDPTGAPGVFSSHGPGLDVLAPGLDVWTTYLTYPSAFGASFPGYLAGSGTSFAAPFATGTVGLLAAARPELAPGDFQHVLRLSARDVDAPGPDGATGFGLLDAAAALAFVGPGNALWHGDAAPALAAVALDTLVVAERGLALLDSLERRALAERWTLRARIALPDSLADSARAWVRVSGTTTTRGDWRVPYVTPWAEVRSVGPRTIELEGALFRIVDARAERLAATSDPARWIPAPPERARITFTMIGTRRQTPAVAPADTAATARSWSGPIRVSPNPVRGAATLSGPPGATVRVVDTAGREIARLTLDATGGRARWDGLGPGGRAIAPGLYWAIGPGGRATRFVRLR
jgi:subtilisin family serine protease